ncbi:DUF7832 domain-containing protein [Variovorax sp. Root318D1]|uniref:DUF7832 domain-containing protein n=1 Tax=Variovorax sp. Root318D1 TaxID=1736513 RepID=UPI0012FCADB1|nr:hypothetical protein [Variovorax sp. Root318D1]
MSIDDASWHSSGKGFPADLPAKHGATHIGMFIAWAAFNNLLSKTVEDVFSAELIELRHKQITPGAFVWRAMEGKLSEFDLSSDGLEFCCNYYKNGSVSFLSDYENLARKSGVSDYCLPDDWSTYQAIADIVDLRYLAWQAGTRFR